MTLHDSCVSCLWVIEEALRRLSHRVQDSFVKGTLWSADWPIPDALACGPDLSLQFWCSEVGLGWGLSSLV